jgi:hypothetical protein
MCFVPILPASYLYLRVGKNSLFAEPADRCASIALLIHTVFYPGLLPPVYLALDLSFQD